MANNNRPDYLESLFQGIDIILEKRLDQVSFDTTIICTITDASNSKNGEYRVTDGNVTYKAYSDLDSYVAGQQVRVSVPMGDYTQKKFIVGKYVVDNDSAPITYVSPLESVVNMSGNLVPLNTTAGIKANGTERSVIIWNQRMDQNSYADLQANGIYNTIILKADFKTLLSNYDLAAGTYGLRLDLLVRPSVNSTGRIRRYVELSSKEMFGNPYAFSIFSTQAKTFNISTIGLVEGIELSLYQCGDFKDRKSGPITANTLTDDIIVNNIELGFGSDIVNIDDNIVKIYSENDLSYKYHNPTDDTNLKKIGLLWYNKDDNNQYIGFSDGIYAPKYDELEYLQLARMDTRLLAQKGREGVPTDKQSLTLAANIEEAVPLIQKARDVANQDLYRVLTEFNNKVSKIDPMTTELKKLLLSSSNETYIGYCTEKITENLTGMQEQYSGVLDYGWDRQTDSERKSEWDTVWGTKYYENINTQFQNIRDNVNAVLTEIQKLATTPDKTAEGVEYDYTGYKGVYDIYSIRIQRVLTSMDEYLGVAKDEDGNSSVYNKNFPTDVLNGVDYNLFAGYQTRTEFKTYKEQDLSAYANKYCIYWYRYERDYVSTDIEKLMPDGWRRLTPDELTGDFDDDGINVGLPGEDVENVVDNKTHHLKTSADGTGFFTISMQPDLNTEKFVALVFYNHNMYKSNELVFTNSDVIPDKTTLDKGDILIFEHGERSSDNFSLYSDLGILMDSADEHYARQIKVHYDGLLAKDEALVGAGVYWYVPNNGDATMLTFDKEYLTNRGFTTDLDLDEDKKPEFSKEGYVCFYKQIEAQKKCSGCNKLFTECSCAEKTAEPYWDFKNGTEFDNRDFWYKIKRIYNEGATQNSILCEVRISEDKDPVNGEQLFTFGTAGTNGTKYTLDVVHTSTMVATTPSDKLVLDVFLKDGNGERLPLYTTNTVSTTAGEAYNCEAKWYFRNGADDGLTLLETDNQATGIEVAKNHFGIIEVTADFAMPVGEVEGDSGDAQKKREIRLDCLQAVPWAAGNYYISGPTQIIYNNYGTLDNMSMFDSPYRLFWERDQKDETGSIINQAHERVENVSWRIKYYIHNGTNFIELNDVAVSPDSTEEEIKQHNQYELYRKYMPVINDGGGLTPSTLYMSNLDCFAVVQALIGKSIVWEQPIIILQNRYASAMLNSWDGSLTIDEKNGTIMSTMIGAGRKSKNNTFEGVLMGNVALGTGSDIGFSGQEDLGYSNQTGLGIYGFHDGAQSFGFNIDGTAFLGKSGCGRIIFNGNNGVIASANWFLNGGKIRKTLPGENESWIESYGTDGMCIDLENGHIDAYNFKLTSKDIYLNSNPQGDPDYYFRIGHTETEEGDLPSSGLLTFDKYGHLILQADRFTLNGNFGGTNILLNTAPAQYLGDNNGNVTSTNPTTGVTHTNSTTGWMWDLEPWTPTNIISITDDTDEVKLSIFNITTKSGISQIIEDIKVGKEYTASVYVYPKEGQTITMSTLGGTVTSTKTKTWEYLTLVFTAEENDKITFSASSNGFKFWHPKVEEGTVATTWGASPKDITKAQARANAMFTQSNIWSILSNNGAMQGAWLINGNYYINASFIAAGAIMSANWKASGGTITDDGSITKYGTEGSAFSLKTGELHAAKFHLVAGTSGKLELNSDPIADSDYYLHIGDNTRNDITFAKNGTLIIRSEIFKLHTSSVYLSDEAEGAQTIAGFAGVNPVLRLGSNFGVTSNGTLYASGANIGGDIYADYIEADEGSIAGWKIESHQISKGDMKLISSDVNGKITASNFKVENGTLTATSAVIEGDITASTGTIGGWTIGGINGSGNGTTLTGGKLTLDSTGSITSTGTGAFSLDTDGVLTAVGAVLEDLTVTNTLTVNAKASTYNARAIVSRPSYDIMDGGGGGVSSVSNAMCTINGTTSITGDTEIGGTLKINSASYITGNLVIDGDTRVNSDFVMNNNTKISVLGANGGESASINFGKYGNTNLSGAGIEINGPISCLYSDTIWIGKPGATKTYINGTTQLNLFGGGVNVQEVNGGAVISLEDYIAKKGGFNLIKIENQATQTKVAQASALSNSSNTITVQAPASLPSSLASGSSTILALTNKDTGATSWYTIAQALGASYGNAGKILKCNAAQFSYSYEWIDIPKELPESDSDDYGKVLKINMQGNPYWGTDNNTTYTTATFAAADHNHDDTYSKTDHTHTGYLSTSGTAAAANKVNCSSVSNGSNNNYANYRLVGTQYSSGANTLYYASTLYFSSVTGNSSQRFKNNIQFLDPNNSNILYNLKPISYNYKPEYGYGTAKRYGFIAEDVLKIAPELVEMDPEQPELCNAIYYNSIITLAVAEIQKLRKELDDLKSSLNI